MWDFYLLGLLCLACLLVSEVSGRGPVLRPISAPRMLGEGPHWDPVDQVLYYVDIREYTVYRYDPTTRTETSVRLDKAVSIVLPLKGRKGQFLVTQGRDLAMLTWDWTSGVHSVSTILTVDQDHPKNTFNDGKADAKGRLWVGTVGEEITPGHPAKNMSTLYRINSNTLAPCRADAEVFPVTNSNGIAWTRNNKVMFYNDTPTRRVDAFDYDLEKGTISNRRTIFKFGDIPGDPDGMTIDSDDNIWIACFNGSRIIQVNPSTGKLLRVIKLPITTVSSVTFGGKYLDILYVTSLRYILNSTELQEQPLAGATFEISGLGVIGTPGKPPVLDCNYDQGTGQFGAEWFGPQYRIHEYGPPGRIHEYGPPGRTPALLQY